MGLSLKPERIRRYKDVVALLIKYGRSDLVQQNDLELGGAPSEALAATAEPKAEELASDLEKLGPTFIKLSPGPFAGSDRAVLV
jgi:predicted unusual protein kinase regulating ubiquinone biosynthesis (AarF/ABC1/UbiB family)